MSLQIVDLMMFLTSATVVIACGATLLKALGTRVIGYGLLRAEWPKEKFGFVVVFGVLCFAFAIGSLITVGLAYGIITS